MNVHEQRIINLTMSPSELRQLADKMEARFPKIRYGESMFCDILHYGKEFEIHLYIDQEYFSTLKNEKP